MVVPIVFHIKNQFAMLAKPKGMIRGILQVVGCMIPALRLRLGLAMGGELQRISSSSVRFFKDRI